MTAYYNEIDPYAAEWLRNLIAAGLIAPGEVDTRSIHDVRPDDLKGFTQCHFFAGIGVWSYALRRAGWPDNRPVWTGSCPCQPFSSAGLARGFADERHLWPFFHFLIEERRPPVVFGEQVASKDGLAWLDLVHADMEGAGYAFAAVDLCAAGVGAPHIRQRLWFVGELADAEHDGRWEHRHGLGGSARAGERDAQERQRVRVDLADGGATRGLGDDDDDARLEGLGGGHCTEGGRDEAVRPVAEAGEFGGLADTSDSTGQQSESRAVERGFSPEIGRDITHEPTRPTNGFWRDADWLFCRDGKWRPVEASPQPLVDGSAESLGRVRPEIINQIEEEINASAMENQIRRPEVLRALQYALGAEAKRCWQAGRIPRLHEAPFLLSFLRQLSAQGWSVAQGQPLPRPEAASWQLRMLWEQQAAGSAPHQQELEGQPSREHSDAVHFLSHLLARYAQAAWGDAYTAYAEIGFPLGHDSIARVGRLRAYGNAIVAEVAEQVIRAYMESAE